MTRNLSHRVGPAFAAIARFIALAFAGAWIVGGIAYAVLDLGEIGLGVGVLMVAVAALWSTRRETGSVRPMLRQILRWRLGARWYAAAVFIPFVALAAALLLGPVLGGEGLSPDAPGLAALLMLPAFVLLFGGPEELGWRGYLLPRLQARFSALTATFLVAAIWMAWHIPVLAVPGLLFENTPLVPYLLVGVASSFIYTWLYNSTGGSILIAMVLHGSTNLSLGWLGTSTATFAVFAGAWVVAAIVLVAVHGTLNLARAPRHQWVREAEAAGHSRRGARPEVSAVRGV